MKWHTIETAPKDGTEILLLGYIGTYLCVINDHWSEDHECWVDFSPRHPSHWAPLENVPPGPLQEPPKG